jgi:hypothetical protein
MNGFDLQQQLIAIVLTMSLSRLYMCGKSSRANPERAICLAGATNF